MIYYRIKKLVRDKFIKNCINHKIEVFTKKLKNSSYEKALFRKLKEESNEVCQYVDKENLAEEIGDVFEVLDCIMKHYGLKSSEVKAKQRIKRQQKGSFLTGVFCDKLSVTDKSDSYWSSYFKTKYKATDET